MAPPDFAGSIGLGKRSVAKEEGANARNTDEDDEPDLLKLSPVGEVLRRASEAGSGVLSVGRCAMLTGWSLPGITRTYHGHGISTPASQCLSDKPAPARPPLASERGRVARDAECWGWRDPQAAHLCRVTLTRHSRRGWGLGLGLG